MKKLLSFITLLCFVNMQSYAQQKCGTETHLHALQQADPALKAYMDAAELARQSQQTPIVPKGKETRLSIIKIPVVVHVVYATAGQNISDAQINSQIARLNLDFRLFNSDSLPINHPFWNFSNDAQIEFCLAHTDPTGAYTSGITRTQTSVSAFDNVNASIQDVKKTSTGGKNNWDPTKYLNLWVCNVGASNLLGIAQFPDMLTFSPNTDGVVVNYRAFGNNVGSLLATNKLGRTATHEIGHWLNLRHIWGDATCGSDGVADTKVAEDKNYGCPNFPSNANSACGSDADGEMYMNYMDYVDDYCMNMFTTGQINRMRSCLNTDRIAMLSSTKCNFPLAISENNISNSIGIFPNPSNGIFTIESPSYSLEASNIEITNTLGAKVYAAQNVTVFPYVLNLNNLPDGLYYINIHNGKYAATKKIIIAK